MSGVHNRSLKRALKIVDAAAASGARMLKLQTYTADTMTINSNSKDFFIGDKKVFGTEKIYMNYIKFLIRLGNGIKRYLIDVKKHGIIGFSTPFDETAVDFLEKLNTPVYKVASFENTHLPLIKKKLLQQKKPVIISTGLANKMKFQRQLMF